ncbi:MAG: 30S ribosomal protein S15 [Chloroflexi bacterium]|nr:30S ribosomal protein S15 [Chloroflexota bacterium]
MIKVNKKEVKEVFKKHDKDTGSAEFQISHLTDRINILTDHLRSNPGDNSSKHGMLKLVGKRSRLLNFLRQDNIDLYNNILTSLGIRK